MHDDPRQNLKWLEQELLAEDNIHRDFSKLPDKQYHEDDDLLELVDMLIGEDETEEEAPLRNFANNYGRESKGQQAVRKQAPPKLEKDAAVLVKSRPQLRREAKQQRKTEKKASVNRNIKGLVFLAILECMGILAILGWWLQ